MNFAYTYFYNPSRILSTIASILGGGVVPLLSLAIYVFTALSLYTIAQRRGLHCPWLAWIPVANLWLMGSLSDQYRYLTQGQVKHKRVALLVLEGITLALTGGMIGAGVWCFVSSVSAPALITLVIMVLLAGGVALAKTILSFMALYDIYASCDPQNATVYLVLSIFFKFLRPIFLFIIRDADKGMPPRKVQPEQAAEPEV